MQKRFRIDVLSHESSWYFKTLDAAAKKQNVDLRLKLFSQIHSNLEFGVRDSSIDYDVGRITALKFLIRQLVWNQQSTKYCH